MGKVPLFDWSNANVMLLTTAPPHQFRSEFNFCHDANERKKQKKKERSKHGEKET